MPTNTVSSSLRCSPCKQAAQTCDAIYCKYARLIGGSPPRAIGHMRHASPLRMPSLHNAPARQTHRWGLPSHTGNCQSPWRCSRPRLRQQRPWRSPQRTASRVRESDPYPCSSCLLAMPPHTPMPIRGHRKAEHNEWGTNEEEEKGGGEAVTSTTSADWALREYCTQQQRSCKSCYRIILLWHTPLK